MSRVNNLNPKNLGFKVTFTKINIEQIVREAEGERWSLPTLAYEFDGGKKFVTYLGTEYDWAIYA